METNEVFHTTEFNDLSEEKLIRSKKRRLDLKNESTVERTSITSSSSAGSSVGVAAGVISAVVTVVTAVVVVVTFMYYMPEASIFDVLIDHESISFSFDGEEHNHPYIITLKQENEVIYSEETTSLTQITYSNLVSATDYTLHIYTDFGVGLTEIRSYQITTSQLPFYPDGRLTIDTHEINYSESLLTLYLLLDDRQNYLYDYYVNIYSGDEMIEHAIDNPNEPIIVSISTLNRGFLTVEVYANSSHQNASDEAQLMTTYKIYY